MLSLVINILMLVTWNARWSIGDPPPRATNVTDLPPAIKE